MFQTESFKQNYKLLHTIHENLACDFITPHEPNNQCSTLASNIASKPQKRKNQKRDYFCSASNITNPEIDESIRQCATTAAQYEQIHNIIATVDGNSNGAVCKREWVYNGKLVNGCISATRPAGGKRRRKPRDRKTRWCGTTDSFDKDGKWGECDEYCIVEEGRFHRGQRWTRANDDGFQMSCQCNGGMPYGYWRCDPMDQCVLEDEVTGKRRVYNRGDTWERQLNGRVAMNCTGWVTIFWTLCMLIFS